MLLFLLIGLGAGVLSGLFGIGGGIVIVPALMYFAKYQPQMATGTSLAALILPVGLLGAITYWKAGNIEIRASLLIAAGLFVGAFFGARIAQSVAPVTLRKLFAVFLVLVAIQLFRK